MAESDHSSIPVRPASSAIILRDGADGIEVLMVVRHHEIDCASGAFVFLFLLDGRAAARRTGHETCVTYFSAMRLSATVSHLSRQSCRRERW